MDRINLSREIKVKSVYRVKMKYKDIVYSKDKVKMVIS